MDSETAAIGVLIGAVLPLIIAVINRAAWSAAGKSVVAFVVCFIAAAASSLIVDGVDVREPGFDLITYFATVYGSAMVAYSRFWKPTTVAPSIERNT